MTAQRCPFLSKATKAHTVCVKAADSRGVCTISSNSNGRRQDWLVCPFRALDENLLLDAVRRVFPGIGQDPLLIAAPLLSGSEAAERIRREVRANRAAVVYFQGKLGGEVSISPTPRSPEFAFDATLVRIGATPEGLGIMDYAIFEIQTMDFHGTYRHAVKNLGDALRLHRNAFATQVESNQHWLADGVEGPNIANVFKRTFYQMMFKFQVGGSGVCAGCVLAIPESVWDSWQRHLGRPTLAALPDGTWLLQGAGRTVPDPPPAWIYVLDIEVSRQQTPNPIRILQRIRTDAASLSHYALDVAPAAALEAGGSVDRLKETLNVRLARYLPEFRRDRTKRPRASGAG
jgi:hypothetical protein